jgi:hypothetical protein
VELVVLEVRLDGAHGDLRVVDEFVGRDDLAHAFEGLARRRLELAIRVIEHDDDVYVLQPPRLRPATVRAREEVLGARQLLRDRLPDPGMHLLGVRIVLVRHACRLALEALEGFLDAGDGLVRHDFRPPTVVACRPLHWGACALD